MTIVYLGLGSNLKNPKRQLHLAIKALSRLPKSHLLKIANFYFNPAQGKKALPAYYNTVLSLNTFLMPKQLLSACQAIETYQGRIRQVKNGARTIDIDILYFGNLKLNLSNLILPHPRILERDFVTVPLNQIQ